MHGFIAHTSKCDFQLSQEVDGAEWVAAEKVGDVIFPDAPGNAAYALYKVFMKKLKEELNHE